MEKENQAKRNCSLPDIEDHNRRATLVKDFGAYTTFDSQGRGRWCCAGGPDDLSESYRATNIARSAGSVARYSQRAIQPRASPFTKG